MMFDAKKSRSSLQKVSGASKQKPKQQTRSRVPGVPGPILPPIVSSALIPTLPYQQKPSNAGGSPEIRTTNLTTSTSTTTRTSRHQIKKGSGQCSTTAIPRSRATVAGVRAGAGAEAKLLTPSKLSPLPAVISKTKSYNIHLNTNPNQVNIKSSHFLPSLAPTTTTAARAAAAAAAAAAALGMGTGKFDCHRNLAGALNNPKSRTYTATQGTSSSAATAGLPYANPVPAYKDLSFLPAEYELAHAPNVGGSIQTKKHHQQQQQQNKEYGKKHVADIDDDDDDDDFMNLKNSKNYNFLSKASVTASDITTKKRLEPKPSSLNILSNASISSKSNIIKSLRGNTIASARSYGGSASAATTETVNLMRRAMADESRQTTVEASIAAAPPAMANILAYKSDESNLPSATKIATSADKTYTTAKATKISATATVSSATVSSATKFGIGYLQPVQSTRVFCPSSSNKTGSASSRHLQNTSQRNFSSMLTSVSSASRFAAGGAPSAKATDIDTDTDTNENIFGIDNTTTAAAATAAASRLVATGTMTNNISNNRISSGGNNALMGSTNMNYSHLYGSNSYDKNKPPHQQYQEQLLQQQQKQHEPERDRDKHVDSKEMTFIKTVSPMVMPSLNDKPPIYKNPITQSFQARTLSHTERVTEHEPPKSSTILPSTSLAASATTYGGNISGSGVVTIPQQQRMEQFAKAAAVAVLNVDQATDNIKTGGIKNSIENIDSDNDQENQKIPSVLSKGATTTADTGAFDENIVSVSKAVKNTLTSSDDGGTTINLQQQRNDTEVEHQSTSTNTRLGAGYTHSLTHETHRINREGNIGGREGFAADASQNSRISTSPLASVSPPRVVTNENILAGIHQSAKPAAPAATISSVLATTSPGPQNNTNSNSNSNINQERSKIRALNSIENIASGSARPTTMPTVTPTATTTTIPNDSTANECKSLRYVAGAMQTIPPPLGSTSTATQRYRERENSCSVIRDSHTLPSTEIESSSQTTSKYSCAVSDDTYRVPIGREAARKGLCGLRNIGNTCFMNSVIQCLSHTTDLTRFLKSHHGPRAIVTKDQQILYEFAKLIQNMWTADVHSVTPMDLKRAFSSKHRMYSDFNQQDAQEFLRFFLDSLHSALNTGGKSEPLNIDDNLGDNKKADLTWEWYIRHENSLIRDLFVGQLKSTLRCTTCGNTSVTFDPFWDLSVSLPSTSRCKLEACLAMFIREEVLDGDEMPTCSKCKTRRKCTKGFTIQRFPKYLVIHLKRFSETRFSKLSNVVEFPTGERELNMRPYAANPSSNVQYSLYAISNHMGSTTGGHYVALCKHPVSFKWHEFNDNIVSDPIIETHLVSSCAYILFYERA